MTSQMDDFLGAHSSLTKTQIQRLLLQISLQQPGEEESRSRISGVSVGAYYRVLSQARTNINQALYTVLFCSRIGLLQLDDLRRLLDLIGKAPSDVPDDNSDQVTLLVEALVKKIVML